LLALEKVRRKTAGDAQAQLASSMNKFEQMGQGGGGASLAAALQTGQSAADRAAMEAMEISAQGSRNRRDAIKQAYDAATGMRASDLSVAERNMENERQKQQFDIQNAANRQKYNAEYANQANRYNLERQQSVMDRNVAQQNTEALRRGHTAKQMMYQNQMDLANAKANAYAGAMKNERERSASQAENWKNIAGGVSEGFGSYAKKRQDDDQDPWSWS
jgi:hypothetical protein